MARTSKWSFLVYPDSAPDNWIKVLENTFIPCAISPKHQPDDEQKKEHWHILLDFGKGQNKSYEQVTEITRGLLNGTYPEIVQSPIGYYEYLIHKNSPEKEQFKNGFMEITHLNGFDRDSYQKIDKENAIDSKCMSVIDIIRTEGFTEMEQLVNYCFDNDLTLLGELKRYGYFYNSYIRSKRGSIK